MTEATQIKTDVAVCLVFGGSQLLIAQRKEDDSFGGFWEFPGGKREAGESLEACAVREVKEELDVNIRVRRFIETAENPYPGKALRLHFFECEIMSGEPRARECADWRWVSREELVQYRFPPANEFLIKRLVKGGL